VAEHAVGVVFVARLALAVVVEVDHVGGAEEPADAELDTVSRARRLRRNHHPRADERGRPEQNPPHMSHPPGLDTPASRRIRKSQKSRYLGLGALNAHSEAVTSAHFSIAVYSFARPLSWDWSRQCRAENSAMRSAVPP